MTRAFKLEDYFVHDRILYRMGIPGGRQPQMIKVTYDYENFRALLTNLDEDGEELTSQEMPIGRAENRVAELFKVGFQEMNEFAYKNHRMKMRDKLIRRLLGHKPETLWANIQHVKHSTVKGENILRQSFCSKEEFIELGEECYVELKRKEGILAI